MMLTGTCKKIDAYKILENLHLDPHNVAFI
jgi:hypothetical protein